MLRIKEELTSLLVALFATLAIIGCFHSGEIEAKVIEDPNLEKAIREEIFVFGEEITTFDLWRLRSLDASWYWGIENLNGLQKAENLEFLRLDYLDIFANIDPIFELEELKELAISHSGLRSSDIKKIDKLEDLEVLKLEWNTLKEIASITSLVELKALDLSTNRIENIEGLEKLNKLRTLDLANNSLKDVTALSKLKNLEKLYLQGNKIEAVSPLVKNEGLKKGDLINVKNNFLDLSAGSQAMEDISALQERGVEVIYIPQREKEESLSDSIRRQLRE